MEKVFLVFPAEKGDTHSGHAGNSMISGGMGDLAKYEGKQVRKTSYGVLHHFDELANIYLGYSIFRYI